jgi:hypothetical protein
LRGAELATETNSSSIGHDRSFDPERHEWFTTRDSKGNQGASRRCFRINELRLERILRFQDFLNGEEANPASGYGVFAVAPNERIDRLSDSRCLRQRNYVTNC